MPTRPGSELRVPIIEIKNVAKAFGAKVIYRDLNLEVEHGENHVIVGRSGEGKSVLLKLICGLMGADEGKVIVDGRQVHPGDKQALRYVRDRVTMVFQMGALFDSLTVRENVGFYLDNRREKSREEIDAICEALLDEVNLPHTGHLLPAELSGGMRKRVGLARALAVEPDILLYDEPTTGLDPVTTEVIGDLIQKTARRHKNTNIVVTHDMKSAYKIADRISMLFEGEIVFTGTPDEVRTTDHPVVHQFVNGLAHGPITKTESTQVERLSTEMIDKSLLLRRIKNQDQQP